MMMRTTDDGSWSPATPHNLAKSRSWVFVLETLRGSAAIRLRVSVDPAGTPLVSQEASFGPIFGVFRPHGRDMNLNAVAAMHRLDHRSGYVNLGVPGCMFESPPDWPDDSRYITGTATGHYELTRLEVFGVTPPPSDPSEDRADHGGRGTAPSGDDDSEDSEDGKGRRRLGQQQQQHPRSGRAVALGAVGSDPAGRRGAPAHTSAFVTEGSAVMRFE